MLKRVRDWIRSVAFVEPSATNTPLKQVPLNAKVPPGPMSYSEPISLVPDDWDMCILRLCEFVHDRLKEAGAIDSWSLFGSYALYRWLPDVARAPEDMDFVTSDRTCIDSIRPAVARAVRTKPDGAFEIFQPVELYPLSDYEALEGWVASVWAEEVGDDRRLNLRCDFILDEDFELEAMATPEYLLACDCGFVADHRRLFDMWLLLTRFKIDRNVFGRFLCKTFPRDSDRRKLVEGISQWQTEIPPGIGRAKFEYGRGSAIQSISVEPLTGEVVERICQLLPDDFKRYIPIE